MTQEALPDLGVTIADIEAARKRIEPYVHKTPLMTSETLNKIASNGTYSRNLFFKCENLQKAGSFKARGATNATLLIPEDERTRGTVTASSGNHGQALALAGRRLGIPVHVVVPRTTPEGKIAAMRGYGAQITLCEPNEQAREDVSWQIQRSTGATYVHAHDEPNVIAGQGTCVLEALDQHRDLLDTDPDIVLTPVGGGGLMTGTAVALRAKAPHVRFAVAEPTGASDAHASFTQQKLIPVHEPNTLADGLLTSLSPRTFTAMTHLVEGVYLVTEEQIVRAMKLMWTYLRIVVEPSGAVTLACVLFNEDFRALPGLADIVLVVSGGNVTFDRAISAFNQYARDI